MGFLSGRSTFVRYRVPGTISLGPEVLEKIEAHGIGAPGVLEAADGTRVGWAGGEHVLDTSFSLEKNILIDALHLAIRVDTNKIPGDLLRAYTRIELNALAAENPSGRPTKAQREQAKEAAQARAEAEAADGRFLKRKHDSVLWDVPARTLYVGTSSAAVADRVIGLFQATFGLTPEPLTTGRLAVEQAEARGRPDTIEAIAPTLYTGDDTPAGIAWTDADPNSRDYLGNDLLVWLWHRVQTGESTVTLGDGSEVGVMLVKTLTLDCPLGQTGSDNLRDEGPCRLPEALRALQSGKLPRKAGLVLARDGHEYELTLQAENLAVSGLTLAKPEGETNHERAYARVENLRHAVETLDLLIETFGRLRAEAIWRAELERIRAWLRAA